MDFEARIKKWSEINAYRYKGIKGGEVLLERISDNYQFQVKESLIEQIMKDDGF